MSQFTDFIKFIVYILPLQRNCKDCEYEVYEMSILPDTEESTTPQIYQHQIRNIQVLKSF